MTNVIKTVKRSLRKIYSGDSPHLNYHYKNGKEMQYFINSFILQNEDISYNGAESEPGNEDKGSACVQGPPGPAGPPGPQV